MTHIIVSFALFLTAAFAVTFLPPVKARARSKTPMLQRSIFKLLVGMLWVFSMHDLIDESGVVYGVLFSLVPVIAGAVVLNRMKQGRV